MCNLTISGMNSPQFTDTAKVHSDLYNDKGMYVTLTKQCIILCTCNLRIVYFRTWYVGYNQNCSS